MSYDEKTKAFVNFLKTYQLQSNNQAAAMQLPLIF